MAMSDPGPWQEAYRAQGLEPDINSSPDEFQKLIEEELIRFGSGHQRDGAQARLRGRLGLELVGGAASMTVRNETGRRSAKVRPISPRRDDLVWR